MLSPSPLDLTTLQNVKSWAGVGSSFQPNSSDDDLLQSCITALSIDWLRRTGRLNTNEQIPTSSPFVQAVQYTERYAGSGGQRQYVRNTPIVSIQSLSVDGVAVPQSTDFITPGWVISQDKCSIELIGSIPRGSFRRYSGNPIFSRQSVGGFNRGLSNVAVTYTAGYQQTVTNELQLIPSVAPFTVIVNTLPWIADLGVIYFSNGIALTPSQIAPTQGQYRVQGSGQYLFNSADGGQQVLISYNPSGVPQDVEFVVRKWVVLNYKRKEWIGISSKSSGVAGAGQTNYLSAELTPDIQTVIDNYRRYSVV